jgi:hypothetical protein
MADIFTDVGETLIADYLDGTSSVPANWYVAWGTDGTAAAKGDTTLTEPGESRVAATMSQPSANINRFVATITATATRAIQEAGVFDASTSGNLLLSSDFTTINLSTDDSIEFTFELTWS